LVHEGRRLEQQDLVTGDTALLQPALELLLGRREAVHLGNDVERHEADIVPVHRILRTGISKTNPELHGGALSESWRQAQALRAASYRLAPSRPARKQSAGPLLRGPAPRVDTPAGDQPSDSSS